MKLNKAYEYRIYLAASQITLIHKTFGCIRFVYNNFLASRVKLYEESKKASAIILKLKSCLYSKLLLNGYREVDSTALQNLS